MPSPRPTSRPLARPCALLAVLAILVAGACSSSDDGGGKTAATTAPAAAEPGSTQGLTATTMKVAVLVPDYAPLVRAGLVPDLGDAEDQIRACRQVQLNFHRFPTFGDTAGVRAACLAATQDDKPFVVVGGAALGPEGALCVAGENRTPIITQAGLTPEIFRQTQGRMFTTGMAWDRVRKGWVDAVADRGDLEGKTIGVLTADDDRFRVEANQEGVVGELRRRGFEIAQRVVLRCPDNNSTCEQHETAVQRFKDAKVDYLFADAGPVSLGPFLTAAKGAGFNPALTVVDQIVNKTVAKFLGDAKDMLDGAVAVSYSLAPDAGPAGKASEEQHECNDNYAEKRGTRYRPGDDAFSYNANNCAAFSILRQAAAAVPEGRLGRSSLVHAMERLDDVRGFHSRPGSFTPTKHDGTDYVIVRTFDAAAGDFPQATGEDWRKVG
jgi:ABC-type branched-subunit amino acid transport system substrate-binding protein